MYPYRRYAGFLAVFATILFAALVVAAFGYLTLLTGIEVIAQADVGVAVGPLMVATSAVALLVLLMVTGMNTPAERQRISPARALAVAVIGYAVFLLTGGVLVTFGDGEPVSFLVFIGGMLLSPSAIALAVIAFVITLIHQWLLVLRINERGRPRWPWEHDDEP